MPLVALWHKTRLSQQILGDQLGIKGRKGLEILIQIFYTMPLVMPLIWVTGALIYYFTSERLVKAEDCAAVDEAGVSFIVPCHNEEFIVTRLIESFDHLNLKDFEILAVNDASTDGTQGVLESLGGDRSNMRVLNLKSNRGKAGALSVALAATQYEFVVCMDADAEIDPDAPLWLLRHFKNQRIAAVTGNPIVKNRGTLVGKLQIGEFSALIGMIKRWQQCFGKLFSLSGVLIMFRKSALLDVGLWDTDTLTEDIGISWKLQTKGWQVRYEPRAKCSVLMPDTLKGLWSQRLRWAHGGLQVMSKYSMKALKTLDIGLLVLIVEYAFSVLWVALVPIVTVIHIFAPEGFQFEMWLNLILLSSLIGFLQFAVGYHLHSKYESYWQLSLFIIWYPALYWILNSMALLAAIPKFIFDKNTDFSSWISPDRGEISFAKRH